MQKLVHVNTHSMGARGGTKNGALLIGSCLYSKPFPAAHDLFRIIVLSNLFHYAAAEFYPTEQRFGWTKMQFHSLINLLRFRNRYCLKLIVIHQQCIPMVCLLSRLLGHKIVIYVGGSPFFPKEKRSRSKIGLGRLLQVIGDINFHLCFLCSNLLLVPSKALIESFNMEKYSLKTAAAPTRIVNVKVFEQMTQLNDRNHQIAYIGRFSYEKGVDIAVDTFLQLAEMDPDLKFIIIGDGPLMTYVKQKVNKRILEGRVEVPGWLNPRDIADYLKKVKLVLVPSRSEGLPSVLLESMACGTPAVVSPVGAMKHVVRDNFNGFLLNTTDPYMIAARICSILKEEKTLDNVSKRAHEFVATRHTEETVLKVWLPILKRLLD